jgi:hypothetical protein
MCIFLPLSAPNVKVKYPSIKPSVWAMRNEIAISQTLFRDKEKRKIDQSIPLYWQRETKDF